MPGKAAIAVLGAGAFGTALAIQLARRGAPVLLWARDEAAIATMRASGENARHLPGCRFPASLEPIASLEAAVERAQDLLLAMPSPALHASCDRLKPLLRPEQGIVCVSKGLEPGSGRLAHEVVAATLGPERRLAIVSGPTFAREVALGLPTAVTVASRDEAFAAKIAAALHGDGFRAYTSRDVTGVEIGGAAKNVLAIAVGIADGLGLGANTRAAMITRGLAEIARLSEALGAAPETIMGLAGLGDIVLTCTDDQSRNRRFGLLLGRGSSTEQALAAIDGVVEGLRAAPEVSRLAARLRVDMPLATHVAAVLAGEMTPARAVQSLVERPRKAESGD